jgi:hypothetical protein
VAADWLDDHREAGRAAIFRATVDVRRKVDGIAQPDLYPVGRAPSEGWALVAPEVEALAAAPEDTPEYRARLERLLRGDVPLDHERLDATLRLQYDLQIQRLASLGLLDERDGELGITAIDGKRYPLPAFEVVLERLRAAHLQEKLSQGFDTLLLVPFGLPLDRLTDAWRQGLRRNAAALRNVGAFNETVPLCIWSRFRDESLVYDHRSFIAGHGGRTKEQLLAAEGRGWDVLLVEGSLVNPPREGQGQTVGGRPQIGCGRSPAEYLHELRRRAEIGLTPEGYIVHFLDALERRGQALDVDAFSCLPGAYLPTSRYVPCAYWYPESGQAGLLAYDPDGRNSDYGARAAVRVG